MFVEKIHSPIIFAFNGNLWSKTEWKVKLGSFILPDLLPLTVISGAKANAWRMSAAGKEGPVELDSSLPLSGDVTRCSISEGSFGCPPVKYHKVSDRHLEMCIHE